MEPVGRHNSYTVTFNAAGGSVSPASMTFTHGAEYSLPEPEREGYTFNGWYLNGSLFPSSGVYNTASSVTLTARWTANSYTISFDANGGSVSPATKTLTYGAAYTLPTPNKTGYTFDGWYLGDEAFPQSGIFSTASNISLTARWSVKSYSITLDAAGGEAAPSVITLDYGAEYALPTPTRAGYTFGGWYQGSSRFPQSGVFNRTSSITLTARWTANSYTVSFDAAGGSVSPASMTFTHGATYQNLPVPEWAFHEFLGWRCGEQLIIEGAEVELTENAVFTAEWREIPRIEIGYDIYFRDDTFGRQTTRFVEWGEPTELGEVFTQSGYRITGWVQTEGEELRLYTPDEVITLTRSELPSGELHLTAMWRETGGTPIDPPPGGEVTMSIGAEELFAGSMSMSMSVPQSVPQSVPPQSQQTQPSNAYVKTYAYDLAGNRTSFTVTRGGEAVQSLSYTYDNLNRLTRVKNTLGYTWAEYGYDVNGNRTKLKYDTNVTTTYTYNAANWVTGVINKRGKTTLSAYFYTYYPSGNQASKTDHNGVTTTYNYDGLGRLTRESESGGLTLAYTYDSAGNRTSMTASGTESYTINYDYDANNRLTSSVYADGTHASTYSYDAAGNLLAAQEWRPQEGIASTASYSYNNLNQLASQTVNGRSSSFAYNADGIRTAKTVGRRLVGYLLDGGNVIGETESGELVATYQRGVNLISCIDPRDTNFEETYYLYNAHGDVVQLADEHGNITKTYEYDAFGNEKNKTSDANPFRYCGEYYDAESGSYYLRARYYNPSVGRFTQEDTHWNTGNMIYGDAPQQIGEYKDPLGVSRYTYAPQTAAIMQAGNLYAYCGGNPLKYVDPTGQEWYHWVIGGVIVAAAAVAVFVTAGGVVPALSAINAVAFGSAAATTVTTVAAGALIGSGTVMTCALITADISSWESFWDSADWTTVAFAAGGFVVGGAYGYKLAADARKVSNTDININIDDKQFGDKWGKHRFDYPKMSSHVEYRQHINKVFQTPDKIILDMANKEYLYVKGNDLLRLSLNGDFVSLYPIKDWSRINNALNAGGLIWKK